MKKIMFNDHYGLTRAVLQGLKTQTRRIYKLPKESYGRLEIESNNIITFDFDGNELITKPKYKIGEIVAVAQSYLQIASELEDPQNASCAEHFEKKR